MTGTPSYPVTAEQLAVLVRYLESQSDRLTKALGNPNWTPRRSHTEGDRNAFLTAANTLEQALRSGVAKASPVLGDIVQIKEGTPYFHDWRGVEMKLVSLRIGPDGERWASVIDKNDPKNTQHRGFGVYDGETTDFEFDHLEKAPSVPSTEGK